MKEYDEVVIGSGVAGMSVKKSREERLDHRRKSLGWYLS